MNITEIERGYLAGFIDGEGSLLINKREHINTYKNTRYLSYSIYIDIGNTNKEVLEWIRSLLGITSKIYENKCKGNRKLAYRLRISYRQAKPLIEILFDNLIIKKKQAEVFLKWPPNKMRGFGEEKEKLFQEMKILNKRGIF